MLSEIALRYYNQGYNCAESLVAAANEAWDLKLDAQALKLAAGLGGGMQIGDVCGAISGAICALGCLMVQTKAHDCADLKPVTQKLMSAYRERLNSLRCDEIKPQLFDPACRCGNTVVVCADIFEEVLKEQGII